MKFFLLFLASFFVAAYLRAQEPTYFVEIGAYAEPVKMDYFKKISNVYETVDANWIYRYRIDVANKTEGEQKVQEAKNVGFAYARLVDVEFSRACCSNQCGYAPPMRTNAKHMPVGNPKAKNDYDIVSGGRILLDNNKQQKGSIYTDKNSAKTIGEEVVIDNTNAAKSKKNTAKSTKNSERKPTADKTQTTDAANPQSGDKTAKVAKTTDAANPQNGDKSVKTTNQNNEGAKPQTDPKTTEEAKPKKKRRQIYNKETGRMEDI